MPWGLQPRSCTTKFNPRALAGEHKYNALKHTHSRHACTLFSPKQRPAPHALVQTATQPNHFCHCPRPLPKLGKRTKPLSTTDAEPACLDSGDGGASASFAERAQALPCDHQALETSNLPGRQRSRRQQQNRRKPACAHAGGPNSRSGKVSTLVARLSPGLGSHQAVWRRWRNECQPSIRCMARGRRPVVLVHKSGKGFCH